MPEDRSTWTGRFSPERVHPRTLEEVRGGVPIVVRDAAGKFLPKIATSAVMKGGSFLVVWAARAEEFSRALQEGDVPQQIPWPAEDVWLPGDAPRGEAGNADPR